MAAATKSRTKRPEPVKATVEGLADLGIDTGDGGAGPIPEPSALEVIMAQANEGAEKREQAAETAASTPAVEKSREPLVDLDVLEADRDTVRLGGKLYELKSAHEFGAAGQHRLERDNREYRELQSSEAELSDTQDQRLELLVDRICETVLLAPVSIKRKLTPPQRTAVVSAFSYAPVLKLARLRQMMEQQAQEAGDGSTTAS